MAQLLYDPQDKKCMIYCGDDICNCSRNPHKPNFDEIAEILLDNLKEKITNLETQVLWGFYEEEYPLYSQGPIQSEIQDGPVTAQEVNNLVNEIKRCHERLEIDHYHIIRPNQSDKMEKVIIPFNDRENQVDGIESRDQTIKLLEEEVSRLSQIIAKYQESK